MNTRGPDHSPADRQHARAPWKKLIRPAPMALAGAALMLTTATAAASAGTTGSAAPTVKAEQPRSEAADRERPAKPLPPPPQMRELAFMLGKFTCTYTPPGSEKKKVIRTTTTRALNGHFYDSRTYIPDDNLRGRQVFGWDPADGKYMSQFHDDWGSTGTTRAAPPQDGGAFKFTGDYMLIEAPSPDGRAKGNRATVVDEVTPKGEDSYSNVQTLTFSNGYVLRLSYDCTRDRDKAGHGE